MEAGNLRETRDHAIAFVDLAECVVVYLDE